MFATQMRLSIDMPSRPRARFVRRPYHPSPAPGPYRLPRDIQERLTASLTPFRNRDAAYALAVFLARFWSAPRRLGQLFAIDRRALTDHPALDLTQARVRGAVRVLVEIGFLTRLDLSSGSKYRATPDGLRRKPVAFQIGAEYASAFGSANKRAAVARGRREQDRRPITPLTAPRPSTAFLEAHPPISPKSMNVVVPKVHSGEIKKPSGFLPSPSGANPGLEAALERLRQGVFGEAEAVEGRAARDEIRD